MSRTNSYEKSIDSGAPHMLSSLVLNARTQRSVSQGGSDVAEAQTQQRPVAQQPQSPNGQGQDASAPEQNARARRQRSEPENHWVSILIDGERSARLREMARVAGGKTRDFYTSLLMPAIDSAIKDFDENRDVVAARARAQAAQTAAEKAAELARKAQEDLRKVESSKS